MDKTTPPKVTPFSAPAAWFATGLGVSVGVPAPGTIGALWGVPLWLAIAQLPGFSAQLAAIAGLLVLGGPLCTWATADLVRLGLASDAKDPQAITWDEFATVPLVYLFAAPATAGLWTAGGSWTTGAVWLAAGFALHRLFDITKPWPCRSLEHLPGGWGVMADDVAASVYAGVVYAVLWRWWSAS